MNNSLDALFQNSPTPQVPAHLKLRIVEQIAVLDRRSVLMHRIEAGAMGVVSLVGIIFFAIRIFSYLSASGFYQYLSLIGSEKTSLLAYWKELGGVLIESLPVTGSVAFLIALGAFFWSLNSWAKNSSSLLPVA